MQLTDTFKPRKWLNSINSPARNYPRHRVIDGLFDHDLLCAVLQELEKSNAWTQQRHTYAAHNVSPEEWAKASAEQRFVQREVWSRSHHAASIADEFLNVLRSPQFLSFLSGLFNVKLTDQNVADPNLNTNYFRLAKSDLVTQHADQSPNREVCLLLYLNAEWHKRWGGELCFQGVDGEGVSIEPRFNRCVVFDPSSRGSEHWVAGLSESCRAVYRYNVTSWYWSE